MRQPKLFIHGRHDTIIPLSSGEALYQIAPEPKQMLIYDAGHNDLWDARMVDDIIRFVQSQKEAPRFHRLERTGTDEPLKLNAIMRYSSTICGSIDPYLPSTVLIGDFRGVVSLLRLPGGQ